MLRLLPSPPPGGIRVGRLWVVLSTRSIRFAKWLCTRPDTTRQNTPGVSVCCVWVPFFLQEGVCLLRSFCLRDTHTQTHTSPHITNRGRGKFSSLSILFMNLYISYLRGENAKFSRSRMYRLANSARWLLSPQCEQQSMHTTRRILHMHSRKLILGIYSYSSVFFIPSLQ